MCEAKGVRTSRGRVAASASRCCHGPWRTFVSAPARSVSSVRVNQMDQDGPPTGVVSVRLVAFAALPAIAVIACLTQPLNAQQHEEIYKWQLNGGDGKAMLTYGGESPEDMPIMLDCKLHSGVIGVFAA